MSCGIPHAPPVMWGLWYHHEVAYRRTSTDFRVLRGWCVGADMEEDLPVMHGSAVSMRPNMVQTVHITYPEFHASVDIHTGHCSTN